MFGEGSIVALRCGECGMFVGFVVVTLGRGGGEWFVGGFIVALGCGGWRRVCMRFYCGIGVWWGDMCEEGFIVPFRGGVWWSVLDEVVL